MPTPDAIVAQATAIANDARWIALGWHLACAAAVVSIAAGWRPRRRTAALLSALPCWSVAALAWSYGNPFNGTAFVALGMVLTAIALSLPRVDVDAGATIDQVAGAALIVFGLVYPHFLAASSWLAYAYESPFGLIPCPTLSVIAGVSLLARGFHSRAWTWILAVALAFYGVIGVVVLSVRIDVVLIAGALALSWCAFRLRPRRFAARVGDFSQAT